MKSESKNRNPLTRALIIAAGRGMRLNSHSQEMPKCLIQVGGRSIIEAILATLQRAGIQEVVIVTGYKHECIEQRLGDGRGLGLKLQYVFNPDWQKKNGVSVFAARERFAREERFLLMMSDHLFSPNILSTLMAAPLNEGEITLAVDAKVGEIFDIDDAMKVQFDGSFIRNIGKELQKYNGIDCGLFKCTTGLFSALESAMIGGDCSLSDGCKQLIASGMMRGIDIGDGYWIDIDTPEALSYAIHELQL